MGLLLLVCFLLRFLGFPDFASTCMPLVGTGVAESPVGFELAFCIGDFAGYFVRNGFGERENGPCCVSIKSVASRIALLGLLGIAGEDDQSLLIHLQSLNINKFPLLTQIPPPMINNNAHPTRFFLPNPSLLKLSKREPTPLTHFPVVSHRLSADCRAEQGERADTEGSGFGFACGAAAELASWLVEPGADAALPVLAEMVRVENIVVSETHRLGL